MAKVLNVPLQFLKISAVLHHEKGLKYKVWLRVVFTRLFKFQIYLNIIFKQINLSRGLPCAFATIAGLFLLKKRKIVNWSPITSGLIFGTVRN